MENGRLPDENSKQDRSAGEKKSRFIIRFFAILLVVIMTAILLLSYLLPMLK